MKAIIRCHIILCGFLLIALGAYAQIPLLNSYPVSSATIYLDFDGQYVTGTSWNWGGPIDAQPATISTAAITEIFNRVAEDYRPFNVNVTTDSAVYLSAPRNKRMRVIVTATSNWYGNAGGVAYVGSFAWGDDTPCWVFSTLLQNNTKWIAEAVSHEAGHTLSLQHQSSFDAVCKKTSEYSSGQGDGEIGWAPIMGVGYYKNLTTWHKGPNTIGCNYIQNDIEIISYHLGYKSDDHANKLTTATNVTILGTAFNVSGLINQSNDTDAFKIMIPIPTNFKLNAIPQNVGTGNDGANIDIRISILDATADTLGVYNPSTLLSAGIDTNLNSGNYYIVVQGVGNINHSEYGSLGFYSLNGQLTNTLPIHQFILKGRSVNGNHLFNWSLFADEPVKHIILERSGDGKDFLPMVTLNEEARNFSYQPVSKTNYYRLKAVTAANEKIYYSNIISISEKPNTAAHVTQPLSGNEMIINCADAMQFRLYDGMGRLLRNGNLVSGINLVSLHKLQKGVFFIQFYDGKSDWTERLIKF
jgi:hypothetical protein